jgi:hypothetical protein
MEIDKNLWKYLSPTQQSLIEGAFYLLDQTKTQRQVVPNFDYSYLVFPVAKAYEGFLKQLFLDMGLIKKWQYESDHFRIGKALSPNLAHKLGKNSIYGQLVSLGMMKLADRLWSAWKNGRNQVFHYFPHNVKALNLDEAQKLIYELVDTMKEAVTVSQISKPNNTNADTLQINGRQILQGSSKNWKTIKKLHF